MCPSIIPFFIHFYEICGNISKESNIMHCYQSCLCENYYMSNKLINFIHVYSNIAIYSLFTLVVCLIQYISTQNASIRRSILISE